MDKDRILGQRAAQQKGLVGLADVAAASLTNRQLRHRRREGRLVSFRRSVHVVNGTPPSWEQAALAACLAASPAAVISHDTAGYHAGIPRFFQPDLIDIMVPYPLNPRLAGVRTHRVTTLDLRDVTVVNGIPSTTIARTVCDVASRFELDALCRLVDNLQRRGQLRAADFKACVERLEEARIRRSMKKLRLVVAHLLPDGQHGDSPPELDIFRLLDAHSPPLPQPVLQMPVVVNGMTFHADIGFADVPVLVEYQGWDGHRTHTDLINDSARSNLFTAHGYDVRYITKGMSDEAILADITAAIERARRRG